MSRAKTFSNRHRIGLCALAMALVAAPILLWWGVTPRRRRPPSAKFIQEANHES